MNPANFPSNVGAGNVMQQPEKGKSDAHMLLKHVGQIIQAQGPFTGWRQSVPIQERVMKVYQMYV